MGQEDIYKLLKKNPRKKYSTSEIAKVVGCNEGSINASLHSLLAFPEICVGYKAKKDSLGRGQERRVVYYDPGKIGDTDECI